MKKQEDLLDWYQTLNEEEIAKITVPVLDAGDDHPHGFPPVLQEPEVEPEIDIEPKKVEDPVVEKDKDTSLVAFVMAKGMQDLLVRIAGLSEPYESDSEQRQAMVDKIKALYTSLGEHIGKL